jgi:hypothetical protein
MAANSGEQMARTNTGCLPEGGPKNGSRRPPNAISDARAAQPNRKVRAKNAAIGRPTRSCGVVRAW